MSGLVLAFLAAAMLVAAVVVMQRMTARVGFEGRVWILSSIVVGAGVLAGVALTQGPGLLGGILAGLVLLASVAWVFLRMLAPQSTQPPAVEVGSLLPPFAALDENGESFDVASLQGHPILLKFFRGHW